MDPCLMQICIFTALKIHMSPDTKEALEQHPGFNVASRGVMFIKVQLVYISYITIVCLHTERMSPKRYLVEYRPKHYD